MEISSLGSSQAENTQKSAWLQLILSFSMIFYLTIYAFESPVRYVLNSIGADEFIFLRDVVIIVALLCVFIKQFFERKIHPAFFVFLFVIGFHGLIMMLNFNSALAVIYSAKAYALMLFGVFAAHLFFDPSRRMFQFLVFIWAITAFGVFINKFDIVIFPWVGMTTTIGGVDVDINRDWTISSGFDKRAAGFTRSSIHVATLFTPLALLLLFRARTLLLRLAIAAATIATLYWTTQKGALLSFTVMAMLLMASGAYFSRNLRLMFIFMTTLVILCPLVLPGYVMPHASGQFSMMSFYDRIENMWPEAWVWINKHEIFPFGVGLGGISGAQRLYALEEMNAADNLFIFMYANFGIMTFLYLGWLMKIMIMVRSSTSWSGQTAAAIVCYIMSYGVFLSLIEDSMTLMIVGAAVAWVSIKTAEANNDHKNLELKA